jgi:uncharacterized protein
MFSGELHQGSDSMQFIDDVIDLAESHNLGVGGGNAYGKFEYIVISGRNRGSTTEAHRKIFVDWLSAHPDVSKSQVGPLRDAWYGWKNEQTSP